MGCVIEMYLSRESVSREINLFSSPHTNVILIIITPRLISVINLYLRKRVLKILSFSKLFFSDKNLKFF